MAFSVLGFIFLLWSCSSFVASLNEEGLALLSFKASLTEFPEGCFSSWDSSRETPCSWRGVTCKEQKVVSLVIPNSNLFGTLAADLGRLSTLRHLNLRDNKLFGGLPSDFFNAKELKSLILSGNSLYGSVPPEIGKLNRLVTLDLSRNSFNGSIPSSIAQCERLKALFLNENLFSGPLPGGIVTSLTTLQRLNLSSNILGGPIPGELGNLSALRATLDLSRNLFSGPVPPSLGNLAKKVYIDLSYNNLSGPIPQVDALLNLGPTAFLGNLFLCGPPLHNPCSRDMNSQSLIHEPAPNPGRNSAKRAKQCHLAVVITIVVGVLAGTFFIGFLLSYFYKKVKANKRIGGCNFKETSIVGKDMFCFAKDVLETLSESMEQYNFVRLDPKIDFNVDQLLTASAFFLGKSGFGIVYKVVLENGLSLAVRRLGEGGGSQRFKEFQNEVEAIGKIKHPNILALRAYCWSVEDKLLIHDYVANGDLATAIHGKPGMALFTPLSWPVRLGIMKGIARGLTHLHEHSPKKYVHGNLKPSNILLGQNMEPQISDLGLCRLANISGESPSFHLEQTETPPLVLPYELITTTSSPAAVIGLCYKAPEASSLRKPSQKWDVYSFGVIMLEMISGKLPLVQVGSAEMDIVQWFRLSIDESKPLLDVLDSFLAHDLDMQNEIISALKIALACVHKSPEKRPSMKYVCDALARLA